MTNNLSTRIRPWVRYTPRDNAWYARDLAAARLAEIEAARISLEAGATAGQAREAAAGNPELDGLAEAMERQQAGAR